MKRVKIGLFLVLLAAISYFLLSYTIFLFEKKIIDSELRPVITELVPDDLDRLHNDFAVNVPRGASVLGLSKNDSVVVQKVTVDAEKNMDDYSFVNMPISQDTQLSGDTQKSLDLLVCHNLEGFLDLVTQSNNDVLSHESCRSCSMHAILKHLKNGRHLDVHDLQALQVAVANVYQFILSMKKLKNDQEFLPGTLLPDQYSSLQHLNRSLKINKKLELQNCTDSTNLAALIALRNIKYSN